MADNTRQHGSITQRVRRSKNIVDSKHLDIRFKL